MADLQAVSDAQDQGLSSSHSSDHPPEFQVRITKDKIKVLLDCPDPHRDLSATIQRIISEFKKLELPQYPDEPFLRSVIENICQPGEHITDAILIMGQPPVPPRHGRLEWGHDYFADGWATDEESGTVDFWAKIDNRSVSAEEQLLVMHPAVAGETGLSVFGGKIAVDKPIKVRVRCGKGVRESVTDDGGSLFTSELNGRVRFADNTLTVDDIYIIKGNVNLEAGNISHTGTLQIEGDVETGATIQADGDIIIKGMLEPANVRTGGTLNVGGGIIGAADHTIIIGGDLHAKYIKEATIRAEGDVIVTSEIDNCDLETRGKVDVSRGRISGGRTIARKGITVGAAGAKGASKTLLAAGLDPTLARRVDAEKIRLKQIERTRIKLRQTIQSTLDTGEKASADEEVLLREMDAKARDLGQQVADGEMGIRRMINEAMAEAREDIFMLRECWAGTTVQLGEFKSMVRVSIPKPRLVKRFKSRVRIVPMGDNNTPEDQS